jgi:hypothetical protein
MREMGEGEGEKERRRREKEKKEETAGTQGRRRGSEIM